MTSENQPFCPWGYVQSVCQRLQTVLPTSPGAQELQRAILPLLLNSEQLCRLLRLCHQDTASECSNGDFASQPASQCSRAGCPCQIQGGHNKLPLLRGIVHDMLRLQLMGVKESGQRDCSAASMTLQTISQVLMLTLCSWEFTATLHCIQGDPKHCQALPLEAATTLLSLTLSQIHSSSAALEGRRRPGRQSHASCHDATLQLAGWALVLGHHSADASISQGCSAIGPTEASSVGQSSGLSSKQRPPLSEGTAQSLVHLAGTSFRIYLTAAALAVQEGWPPHLAEVQNFAESVRNTLRVPAPTAPDGTACTANNAAEDADSAVVAHKTAAGGVGTAAVSHVGVALPAGSRKRKSVSQSGVTRADHETALLSAALEQTDEPPQWLFDRVANRKHKSLSDPHGARAQQSGVSVPDLYSRHPTTPANSTPAWQQPGSSSSIMQLPGNIGVRERCVVDTPSARRITPIPISALTAAMSVAPLPQGDSEWPQFLNKFVQTDRQNQRILQGTAQTPSREARGRSRTRGNPDESRVQQQASSARGTDGEEAARKLGRKNTAAAGTAMPRQHVVPRQQCAPLQTGDESSFVSVAALRLFTRCMGALRGRGGAAAQELVSKAVMAGMDSGDLMAAADHVLHTVGSFGPGDAREMTAGVTEDPPGAMAAAVAAHLHRSLHVRAPNALAERPPPPGFPPPASASRASIAASYGAIRALLAASASGLQRQSVPHLRARHLCRMILMESGGTVSVAPAMWPAAVPSHLVADAVRVALEGRDSQDVVITTTVLAVSLLQGDPRHLPRWIRSEMPPSPWLAHCPMCTQQAALMHLMACLRAASSAVCTTRASKEPMPSSGLNGGSEAVSDTTAARHLDFDAIGSPGACHASKRQEQQQQQQQLVQQGGSVPCTVKARGDRAATTPTPTADANSGTTSSRYHSATGSPSDDILSDRLSDRSSDRTSDGKHRTEAASSSRRSTGRLRNDSCSPRAPSLPLPPATLPSDSPADIYADVSKDALDSDEEMMMTTGPCLAATALSALLRFRAELQGAAAGKPMKVTLFGRAVTSTAMSLAAVALRLCANASYILAAQLSTSGTRADVEAGKAMAQEQEPIRQTHLERLVVAGAQLLGLMTEVQKLVSQARNTSPLKRWPSASPLPPPSAIAAEAAAAAPSALVAMQAALDRLRAAAAAADPSVAEGREADAGKQQEGSGGGGRTPNRTPRGLIPILQLLNDSPTPLPSPLLAQQQAAAEKLAATTDVSQSAAGKVSHAIAKSKGKRVPRRRSSNVYIAACLEEDQAHSNRHTRPLHTSRAAAVKATRGRSDATASGDKEDADADSDEGYTSLEDFIDCEEDETVEMYRSIIATNYRYTAEEEPDAREATRVKRAAVAAQAIGQGAANSSAAEGIPVPTSVPPLPPCTFTF